MKAIFNWRYWVIAILFTAGILAIGRAFGDAVETMSDNEWLIQVAVSFTIGSGCFFVLGMSVRRWEREGKIPEFTKQ